MNRTKRNRALEVGIRFRNGDEKITVRRSRKKLNAYYSR